MKAIDILHAQCGQVSSRVDGSLTLKFITPEMLASHAGICLGLHGKNVRLTIIPEDVPPTEVVRVDTERAVKTPSQRLRNCLYILWQQNPVGTFNEFYDKRLNFYINEVKSELP